MKKLVIIDSHAVIHRAYHALPPLTSPKGEPTQAVYGFTTILLRILRELTPEYIVAAFDLPGPTFRHIASERYKATRPETPDDLGSQFGKVKEILDAFGILVFEQEGYEADDIVGTLVKKFERAGDLEIIIVTGDMDVLQLVGPHVRVYAMRKGVSDTVIYDSAVVREKYGFEPKQMIDFKALRGDVSDNIAGVKGIGEKTATILIQEFGSVEELYRQLDKGTKKISASVAQKLKEGKEDAFLSKELATIHTAVPLDVSREALVVRPENQENIRKVFEKFGFFGLMKRLAAKDSPLPHAMSQTLSFTLSDANKEKTNVIALATTKDFTDFITHNKEKRFACSREGDECILVREKDCAVCRIPSLLLRKDVVQTFFRTYHFFCYDVKAVLHLLRSMGGDLGEIEGDIMIMSYLAGSFSRDFSYAAILGRELGRPGMKTFAEEMAHIFEIAASLDKKITTEEMQSVLADIEMPIIRILADMEKEGVLIDSTFLKKLATIINKELEILTTTIYKEAGEEFNINSPRQLSHMLFDVLGLTPYGLRKTPKGGVISTGATELEKLKTHHPIVEHILSYRELTKLKTTYIDALPFLIDPADGRIHTTFNQTVASTGRLSSSNPNLQNIPIISAYGREIRKAFVAPDDFVLCSFDYSQIELRVAAHMAGDKKMIQAFREGFDIHSMTASAIYGVPLDRVTPDFRRAAKTLNFGILYGMGANALAESTNMSVQDAKKFIDDYFREFAGVKIYLERTKRFAETHGYVQTLFGRRRYIPEIQSSNWQLKREAERMAINMPIQGTATGDIVKMAMIAVDVWIREHNHTDNIKMILQVHDELVFEIRKSLAAVVIPQIKAIMENVAHLDVPLVVDVKMGRSWGEQERFTVAS